MLALRMYGVFDTVLKDMPWDSNIAAVIVRQSSDERLRTAITDVNSKGVWDTKEELAMGQIKQKLKSFGI